ncbi:MAG: hypothetical protein R3C01_05990 [Planctomycetaceae bacterium]
MSNGTESPRHSQHEEEIDYLLFRLRRYSFLLEFTSAAVYSITAAHVVIVFYTLMTFEDPRDLGFRRYGTPFRTELFQLSLIFLIAAVIFVRDRLIVMGNDLFQVISDKLEHGKAEQNDESTSDTEASASTERDRFTPTKIRLSLRRFVSLTHLPLFRKSESGEFVYLSFNIFLGIATLILRLVLFWGLK